MMRQRHSRGGFALLSVLMALAIVGILTGNFMGTDTPTGQPYAVYQQQRARAAVTMANTRTAQTQFFMATEGRRLQTEQLRQVLDGISTSMGQGGRFFTDPNQSTIFLTTTDSTTKFHESLQFPRVR